MGAPNGLHNRLSRSVTSCAGMTAHLVLLAQTRVGFLSWGRSKDFQKLSDDEQRAQREEAYARATVALTRAQTLRVIMGPLDLRGLVGAATVIGCPKYGAGLCGMSSLQVIEGAPERAFHNGWAG